MGVGALLLLENFDTVGAVEITADIARRHAERAGDGNEDVGEALTRAALCREGFGGCKYTGSAQENATNPPSGATAESAFAPAKST